MNMLATNVLGSGNPYNTTIGNIIKMNEDFFCMYITCIYRFCKFTV